MDPTGDSMSQKGQPDAAARLSSDPRGSDSHPPHDPQLPRDSRLPVNSGADEEDSADEIQWAEPPVPADDRDDSARTDAGQTPAPSTWIIDDNDRYARLRLIGWWEQEKLSSARVLVVGAGALGNEVLKNLVLLGVGEIHVIDFDRIQPSNLARSVLFRAADAGKSKAEVAAAVASELNPDSRVYGIDGDVMTDVGLGFVRRMDVVIGCVDNREARLWINRMCWKVQTPWIDGGIQEINGVVKVFVPHQGPCYECGMTDRDYELIQLRYSCPLLKHDDVVQGKVPTAPTIASIIGGMQVQEALKLIHGMPTSPGTAHVFNGVANRFYSTKFPFREDCLSHELYDPIEVCEELSHQSSLGQVFRWVVGDPAESNPITLVLDRDYLQRLECAGCGNQLTVGRPRSAVSSRDGVCSNCQLPMRPIMLSQIELQPDDPRRLMDLGIPDQDILQLRTGDDYRFLQLSPQS